VLEALLIHSGNNVAQALRVKVREAPGEQIDLVLLALQIRGRYRRVLDHPNDLDRGLS
jgi:hypothetical protein